jgi:hypothetical protein
MEFSVGAPGVAFADGATIALEIASAEVRVRVTRLRNDLPINLMEPSQDLTKCVDGVRN